MYPAKVKQRDAALLQNILQQQHALEQKKQESKKKEVEEAQ